MLDIVNKAVQKQVVEIVRKVIIVMTSHGATKFDTVVDSTHTRIGRSQWW